MLPASAKLRKILKYPTDDSDEDNQPTALDEEEQEKLIAKLREENDERNEVYKRYFLAIPIISMMTYIPTIMVSTLIQAKLVSFINMTSLMATAYTLVFIPNMKSKPARPGGYLTHINTGPGPIRLYLPYLNGALSILLALNALTWRERRGVHAGFWVLCLLPAVVFSVVIFVKKIMVEVNIDEIEDLKYGYKGA